VDDVGKGFLDAALTCLATSGLKGFSLRGVAQRAGGSLGSLSYRFRDKAGLVGKLIERELAERSAIETRWHDMLAGIDPLAPGVLADLIAAYLDEMALARREASSAMCELLIGASLAPADFPGFDLLIRSEVGFWSGLIGRSAGSSGPLWSRAVAGYVRDELPFTIACGAESNYRLLRAATIRRIAEAFSGQPSGLSADFDRLVAACGMADEEDRLSADQPPGSRKAGLAAHLAFLVAEQGIAAVTHRSLAGRAGVPHSSVAHYFRTREDLLYAAIAGLAALMRDELNVAERQSRDRSYGLALIRATHSVALAAARDPSLMAFALDMRRWRAINVRTLVGEELGVSPVTDGAGIQAAVISLIGCALAAIACNEPASQLQPGAAELRRLRCGT
jgi:AcrR family transcriptional regulator